MAFFLRSVSILCLVLLSFNGWLSDSSACPPSGVDSFIHGVRLQCPVWIERFQREEVTGDELDRDLARAQGKMYHSILFHASWCPFSRKIQPTFDALSLLFPQIRHLSVEESSVMPRYREDDVLSRYGVHSFPSILLANRTSKLQYHGPKDLNSLVKFYKEATGFNPVAYFSIEDASNSGSRMPLNLWDRTFREITMSEPYLAFSVVFICMKVFVCFFPVIISRVKAFLVMHVLHLNLGIFGEWNHLLERIVHVIDLKKLWSKLRLSNKTRNFQKGAKNARVWASSLASVSLGESSSSRDL